MSLGLKAGAITEESGSQMAKYVTEKYFCVKNKMVIHAL